MRPVGVGTSIDESQLTGLIRSHLVDRGQEPLVAGQAASELLEHCSRRAWILTKIGSSDGINRFSFTHRTFFEFFAAEAIIRKVNRERALPRNEGEAAPRLGSVSRVILDVYLRDSTSVMPELLLQAADDLMGGMSTPILGELQREAQFVEPDVGLGLIGLCVRLVAAGGAKAAMVDRVFDSAARRWSNLDRMGPPVHFEKISLADLRPLLDVAPAHRKRFIQRCLKDSRGVGRFFYRRYARLAVRGETGLYSDEWKECSEIVAGRVEYEPYDPIEVRYRYQLGRMSLDTAVNHTIGLDLLALTVDGELVPGVIWESFADPSQVESATRYNTWERALQTLISDDRVRRTAPLPIEKLMDACPGVVNFPVPSALALCIALLSPTALGDRLARVTGQPRLMEATVAVRTLEREVAKVWTESQTAWSGWSIVRAKLSQTYSEFAGTNCPEWVKEYVAGPYARAGRSLAWPV